MMRTKLTLLALLASASFLVQAQTAQTPAAGNQPLNAAAPSTSSNTTRDAVENKAASATSAGAIATGNEPLAPKTTTNSTKSRSAVMEQGTAAQKAGTIRTGDGSSTGDKMGTTKNGMAKDGMPKDKMRKSDKVKKSDKMQKSGKMMDSKTGAAAESVKTGNAPYTQTPSTMSNKSRSEVNSGIKAGGGADGVASGNQPIAKTPSTMSTTDRATVQAGGAAAVKNDTLKTGDGAPQPAK